MRTSRFSLDEIGGALQQTGQGVPVPEVAARLGVSQQTIYRWKKLYSGLTPGQGSMPFSVERDMTTAVPPVPSGWLANG